MKPNPTILIVDDEQANTAHISELLKQGGYTVTTASDGFKALAACKVRLPDLILLDLYMPLMSGLDVFKRLKVDDKTRYIPIIFLKNKEEPAPALDKEDLEEHPLLIKPLEARDIVSLVKTVLREKFLGDELRKRDVQIRELSLVDSLTSFKNLRFLTEFLKMELPQCQRYKAPLSLILIAPDSFKEFQKTHGYKASDSLLVQLAVILSRQNRKSDVLARSGPHEFAMVLTHTDRNGAVEVAERLRNVIAASTFTVGDKSLQVTASLGISQFSPDIMDIDGTTLLSHGRAALTQGHSNGGNVTLMAE